MACYVEEGRLVLKTRQARVKKGIVDQTFGLLADLDYDLKEYINEMRKDSGRRLDANEGSL